MEGAIGTSEESPAPAPIDVVEVPSRGLSMTMIVNCRRQSSTALSARDHKSVRFRVSALAKQCHAKCTQNQGTQITWGL